MLRCMSCFICNFLICKSITLQFKQLVVKELNILMVFLKFVNSYYFLNYSKSPQTSRTPLVLEKFFPLFQLFCWMLTNVRQSVYFKLHVKHCLILQTSF